MTTRELVLSLIVGVITNIVAASFLSFGKEEYAGFVLVTAAVMMGAVAAFTIYRLRTLGQLGFKGWESSVNNGTSTRDCILMSQRSIDFMGIAATKWTDEGEEFRKLLIRHASNGGQARFLLLNPFGNACKEFEIIKGRAAESLQSTIIDNAQALLRLKSAKLPIDIRFYDASPHFRVVTVDGTILLLGLYAYFNDDGRGGPQLLFDGKPRAWSFYNAFSAYFNKAWEGAAPAERVLANRQRRRKGDIGAP